MSDPGVGGRVAELRKARGLSQSALAAGRFSKEYVSQIERGKTRPSEEALAWLADRLGVDVAYLTTGVSEAERGRVESALRAAERSAEEGRHAEAVAAFAKAGEMGAVAGSRRLRLRVVLGESWSRIQSGELEFPESLLAEAEGLVSEPLDRAELSLRRGVLSYRRAEIDEATRSLGEALRQAEASDQPVDRLRVEILGWRARCYRRSRDWLAADEDVGRAIELAAAAGDTRGLANALSQAAILAHREGRLLLARSHGERARALYAELDDQVNVARLTNDLGAFNLQLDHLDRAITLFEQSWRMAQAEGNDTNAALALGSLAEAHRRSGDPAQAEEKARRALALFADRLDFLEAIGAAQLTLARALLELNRSNEAEELLDAADKSFEQLSSVSHQAAAWVARGDLAERRGDPDQAARLYRQAAEALRQSPS